MHGEASGRGYEVGPAVRQKVFNIDRSSPLHGILYHDEGILCIMLPGTQKLQQETLTLLHAGVECINQPITTKMLSNGVTGLSDGAKHAVDHTTELWERAMCRMISMTGGRGGCAMVGGTTAETAA